MNALESKADKLWRDEFVIRLRMQNVPGPVIGDALKTVTTHSEETGESFEEAFGDAHLYAESLSLGRSTPVSTYLHAIPVFAGAMFLASGVMSLARGVQAELTWADLATGFAVIVGVLAVVQVIKRAKNAKTVTLGLALFAGTAFVVGIGFLVGELTGDTAPFVRVNPWLMIGAGVVLLAYEMWEQARSNRKERIADPLSGADISGDYGKWAVIGPVAVPVVLLAIVIIIGLVIQA